MRPVLGDHRDDDALLLEELGRPPSVGEAWESLQYWRTRRERLSPLRRRDRREADRMVAVWRERLRAAERAEYGPPAWEPLVHALRLHHLPDAYHRTRRRVRRALMTAAAVGATLAAGAAGAGALLLAHLL